MSRAGPRQGGDRAGRMATTGSPSEGVQNQLVGVQREVSEGGWRGSKSNMGVSLFKKIEIVVCIFGLCEMGGRRSAPRRSREGLGLSVEKESVKEGENVCCCCCTTRGRCWWGYIAEGEGSESLFLRESRIWVCRWGEAPPRPEQ